MESNGKLTVFQACEMEDGEHNIPRWGDLYIDILVRIFQSFDIFELTTGIDQVCNTWRLACCDPILWKTLDLSMLKSNFIKTQLEPYVYVDGRSDETLTRILKISLNLSRGSILTLIFHYNLYISDDQLTYTAKRCPQLRRLVMPGWNRIKRTGICEAIRQWKGLKSLTMPCITNPRYLMDEIARNCNKFAELKIMSHCDTSMAKTLVECLPNLKVLSLRCTTIWRDALMIILDGLQNLEVLNISHCLLLDVPPPARKKVLRKLDESILQKANKLKRFIMCMSDSCIMCQRMRNDEGLIRWHKYEEELWKEDEVTSLAV